MSPTADAKTRARIATTQLLKRLEDNAFGRIELNTNQIKSIEILLRKTMPDLTHVTGALEVDVKDPLDLNDADLAAIAAGRSAAFAAAADGEAEPDQFH